VVALQFPYLEKHFLDPEEDGNDFVRFTAAAVDVA
jgi:hypothetical protein